MPPKPALFVVEKIIEQAAIENIALSEVERKMLLFSESSPTLPDIAQVNEVFDREGDVAEYETKVAGLIRGIQSSLRKNAEARHAWDEAMQHLRGEDYYFMVMLNEAVPHELFREA